MGRQFRVHSGQVQNGIDLADQVIVRNHLAEVELIEQVPLPPKKPILRASFAPLLGLSLDVPSR